MLKFGEVIEGDSAKESLISLIDIKIAEINDTNPRDVLWGECKSGLVKVRRCIMNGQTLDELFGFELESANNLLFS